MRTAILLCCLCLTTLAWGQTWQHGTVTKAAWLDPGGFYVEVDETPYLFMREAKIVINGVKYEVPDRMHWLTPKSRVRILREGFRIYELELERRYGS